MTKALIAGLTAAAVPSLVLGPATIGVVTVPLCVLVIASLLGLPRAALSDHVQRPCRSAPAMLLAATFLAWLPAVILSLDPLTSAWAWLRTVGVVALGVLAWLTVVTDQEHPERPLAERAAQIVIVASAIGIGLALASLTGPSELLNLIRFQGWHPRDAANGLKAFANAGMLLIPAVVWAGARLGGGWRLAAGATVLGAGAVIMLTATAAAAAGMLAILAVASLALVARNRKRWQAIVLAILLAAAVLFAGRLLVDRESVYASADIEPFLPTVLVDLHRQVIWTFTWEQALEAPAFGHGLDVINRVEGAKDVVPGLGAERIPSHPHNWALEIFAEAGVVGLAPMLAFIAIFGLSLLRAWLRRGCRASLAALLVSVGYWTSGLFNFSFWASWWQLAHILLVVLLLSLRPSPRHDARSSPS